MSDEDAWKMTGNVSDCLEQTKIPKRYYNWVHSTRLDNLYNFGNELYKGAIWLNLIVIDRPDETMVSSNKDTNDNTQISVTGSATLKTRVKTNISWKSR